MTAHLSPRSFSPAEAQDVAAIAVIDSGVGGTPSAAPVADGGGGLTQAGVFGWRADGHAHRIHLTGIVGSRERRAQSDARVGGRHHQPRLPGVRPVPVARRPLTLVARNVGLALVLVVREEEGGDNCCREKQHQNLPSHLT